MLYCYIHLCSTTFLYSLIYKCNELPQISKFFFKTEYDYMNMKICNLMIVKEIEITISLNFDNIIIHTYLHVHNTVYMA